MWQVELVSHPQAIIDGILPFGAQCCCEQASKNSEPHSLIAAGPALQVRQESHIVPTNSTGHARHEVQVHMSENSGGETCDLFVVSAPFLCGFVLSALLPGFVALFAPAGRGLLSRGRGLFTASSTLQSNPNPHDCLVSWRIWTRTGPSQSRIISRDNDRPLWGREGS